METTKYAVGLDGNLNETKIPISSNGKGLQYSTITYDTMEAEKQARQQDKQEPTYIAYKKRFVILVIFSLYSLSSAFQWIQYSIVATVIAKYYNVPNIAINLTSMIYMILYIPGILPATWLLSKKGLRFCVCLGAFGNMAGSFIKCFSTSPDQFWLLMIGQSIVAAAQLL